MRRHLLLVPPLLLLVLALAGCGSDASGQSSGDASGQSGAPDSPTSTATATPSDAGPATADVVLTPAGCTMPRLQLDQDVVAQLLYARADSTSIPGVTLLLSTAAPGGDTVRLSVTRTTATCRGVARLTTTAHRPVTVLGMTLESSAATASAATSNRATVSVTVRGAAS
ncbi:MAG: hypothetical protein ABI776_00095 [Nocardioidaceae bacterium]